MHAATRTARSRSPSSTSASPRCSPAGRSPTRSRGRLTARGFTGLRFSHGFLVQRLIDAEQPIAALAQALDVTQQAVSKTVSELEGLGYVRRRPDPRDARVRLVSLTDRGRAAVDGGARGAGGRRGGAARAARPAPRRRRDARPARGARRQGGRGGATVACAHRLECAGVTTTPPLCPSCGQPASTALAGAEHDWECRNEACPEFGQPIDPNEPAPPDPPTRAPDRLADRQDGLAGERRSVRPSSASFSRSQLRGSRPRRRGGPAATRSRSIAQERPASASWRAEK